MKNLLFSILIFCLPFIGKAQVNTKDSTGLFGIKGVVNWDTRVGCYTGGILKITDSSFNINGKIIRKISKVSSYPFQDAVFVTYSCRNTKLGLMVVEVRYTKDGIDSIRITFNDNVILFIINQVNILTI
jgi:hypothetical protein